MPAYASAWTVIIFLNIFQVGSNGIISFGSLYNDDRNMIFTTSFTGKYLVAPFWDSSYVNSAGSISYGIFESGDYYLEQVNTYIQRERQNIFQGTWMMNVYYREVLQRSQLNQGIFVFVDRPGIVMKVIALISCSWLVLHIRVIVIFYLQYHIKALGHDIRADCLL